MLPMTLGDPKQVNIHFKFGGQVDHVKSQPIDNKSSQKGRGQVTTLNFWANNHNSETTEATDVVPTKLVI